MNPTIGLEALLISLNPESVTNFFVYLMLFIFIYSLILSWMRKASGFVHYTPNLLTTLGILGTFVGIVMGLLEFDVKQIEQSISPLLEGLKTAFITSLVGMLLAIVFKALESSDLFRRKAVFSVPEQIGPQEIHAELMAQRHALEKLALSVAGDEESSLITQVKLLRSDARDHADRNHAQIKQQSDALRLLSELASQQEDRHERLKAELFERMDRFAEMLSKSATEQIVSALKDVITDFNRNLTEQFGDNFKALNQAVHALVEWQENYRLQLIQMHDQYAHGVEAIIQTESSVAHISEQSRVIPQAMSELKNVLEVAQHQMAELERHLEAFKAMRDHAVAAVPEIKKQMDLMVEDVASSVKEAGEKIVFASGKVNETLITGAQDFEERVNRTNENLTNASDDLAKNSIMIRDQFDALVQDINASNRDMVGHVKEQTAGIRQTLVDANSELGTAVERIHGHVSETVETLLKHLSEELRRAVESQLREVDTLNRHFEGELSKSMGKTSEAVNGKLEMMDKAMQQELTRVIQSLGNNLAAITDKFTKDYSRLTQEMATVVNAHKNNSSGR